MRPNFELLRDAFAIIDGIPEAAFNLCAWTSKKGESLSCGTIACAGGWIARHPTFTRIGVSIDAEGDVVLDNGCSNGAYALAEVFSLNIAKDEELIFSSRGYHLGGYKDYDLTAPQRRMLTDKQLWKRRVLRLFQEYDEPFDATVGEGLLLDVRQ